MHYESLPTYSNHYGLTSKASGIRNRRQFQFSILSFLLLHLDLGAHQSPVLFTPKKREIGEKGKIVLDVFCNSQCPWCGWMANKIKENVKASRLTVNIINTDRRDSIEKFGIARGIAINGEPLIKRMATWKEVKSALESAKV